MGSIRRTKSGKQCKSWMSASDSSLTDNKFPDGSRAAAGNNCRNPDGKPDGPWCYTTDPNVSWETCDVPPCKGECRSRCVMIITCLNVNIVVIVLGLCYASAETTLLVSANHLS